MIHPWGEAREDRRFAMLMAQQANMHRDEKKPPYSVEDFVADYETAALRALFAKERGNAVKHDPNAIAPENPKAMALLLKSMFPGKSAG